MNTTYIGQVIQQSALAEDAEDNIAEGKSYGQKGVAHHMLDVVKNKLK